MNTPYLIELDKDHAELLSEVRLPSGRVAVFAHGEFCCYTELNETGFLDLLLPERIYEQLQCGHAVITFPTREIPFDQLLPDGRTKRVSSVRIEEAVPCLNLH